MKLSVTWLFFVLGLLGANLIFGELTALELMDAVYWSGVFAIVIALQRASGDAA